MSELKFNYELQKAIAYLSIKNVVISLDSNGFNNTIYGLKVINE